MSPLSYSGDSQDIELTLPQNTGYQYCVATNDSTVTPPSTTTAGPTSPRPEPTGPPAPTMTGQPANCNEWHVVVGKPTTPSGGKFRLVHVVCKSAADFRNQMATTAVF